MKARRGGRRLDWQRQGRGEMAHLKNTRVRDGRDIIMASASHAGCPAIGLSHGINDAMDPATAPGKVRTLADMSEEERAEMQRLYGRNGR